MHSRSLYAGTRTVTGSVTGGPHAPVRLARRACTGASTSISAKRPKLRKPTSASMPTSTGRVYTATWVAQMKPLPAHSWKPCTGTIAGVAPSASEMVVNR